jgi:uncharacterized membrane protein YfcA
MLIVAALLSLLIGLSLGLLGGGGSILTLPILVYVLGVEPKAAIAMSLFVVGVTSATGAIAHARSGRLRVRTGLVFGATAMAGAYAGGQVARFVPATALLVAFAVVMLVTSVAMMRGRRTVSAAPAGDVKTAKVLAIGGAVGVVAGLVGAGGGFLIVPALALFGGLAMPEAVATSLLVISLQSFAGFAGHAGHVHLDWTLVLVVTAAAVAGSFLGARLGRGLSPDNLRRGFAYFVLAMAVFLLAKQLPAAAFAAILPRQGVMDHFTPIPSLIGGVLIGLSAALLLLFNGRVAGISGIFGGLLIRRAGDVAWRASFVAGLLAGGFLMTLIMPSAFPSAPLRSAPVIALAGLLVGFGTRLGNGCTSGHGVCGISRFSVRSMVATVVFMTTGVASVFVFNHLLGAAR